MKEIKKRLMRRAGKQPHNRTQWHRIPIQPGQGQSQHTVTVYVWEPVFHTPSILVADQVSPSKYNSRQDSSQCKCVCERVFVMCVHSCLHASTCMCVEEKSFFSTWKQKMRWRVHVAAEGQRLTHVTPMTAEPTCCLKDNNNRTNFIYSTLSGAHKLSFVTINKD